MLLLITTIGIYMGHIETEYPAIALLLIIAYSRAELLEKDEETIRSLASNFGAGQKQVDDLIAHFEEIDGRMTKNVGIDRNADVPVFGIRQNIFRKEAKHFVDLLKEKKTDKTAVLMAIKLLTERQLLHPSDRNLIYPSSTWIKQYIMETL